ncbi:MAG: SDR family oxidoreductase [Dehalococcoidia bacterium]|nr:SDR family oxidoreductase [Dehalococcoidia bacterium]
MRRRLLVTGASGTLGAEVARQALEGGWDVVGTYHRVPGVLPIEWRALNLDDPRGVDALLEEVRPDAIIHTAYVYRGDRPDSWTVTAEAPAWIARAARHVGARLVHLSSDVIFDGTASPYDETAHPSPITPYGAAKAAAEVAVAALDPSAAIVRTSLIVRLDPPDPQTQMVLDIAAGRRPERLFTDELRCPIAVEDLASAVLELAAGDVRGVLHVAGPEAVTRHELGRLILSAYGIEAELPASTIAASGLRRPADVQLVSSLAQSLLRTRVRGVRELLSTARASGRGAGDGTRR